MGNFRNHFASLLVLGVFALPLLFASLKTQAGLSSDEAKPIVLRMLSFSDPKGIEELQDWENRIIPGNVRLERTFYGFRAGPGNSMQRAPVGGVDPETGEPVEEPPEYPVKCQFLVVADVPDGVERINWNILGGSACIIGAPDDSQFIDSSHVVTPVVPTPQIVQIENTHYATETTIYEYVIESSSSDRLYKLKNYDEENFYGTLEEREERHFVEYKREFRIDDKQTYIIITATQLGQTDIVASCEREGMHPAESLVFATVKWVVQRESVKGVIEKRVIKEEYNFAANIVDINDPLDWDAYLKGGQDIKVQFEISVENKGMTAIPKNLLFFRIYPDIKPNWWENDTKVSVEKRDWVDSNPYCYKWSDLEDNLGSEVISPGETAIVKISPKIVKADAIDPTLQGRTPFEIQNTELYFMGPRSSGDMDGYGIRTNESTTVVAGVPMVSGLSSIYDGNVITLQNQGVGPIYLDTLNSDADTLGSKVILSGTGKIKNISFSEKIATIKFHVKSKIDGKEHRADASVTLRY